MAKFFIFRPVFAIVTAIVLTLAGIIFDPLTKVIINHAAGVAALAVYEIAYRIVSQSRQLIVSASTPLVAVFAVMGDKDRADAPPLLKRAGVGIQVEVGDAGIRGANLDVEPAAAGARLQARDRGIVGMHAHVLVGGEEGLVDLDQAGVGARREHPQGGDPGAR